MPTLMKTIITDYNCYAQYKCECGGQYYSNKKYRHVKTIKHNDYLKDIEKNKKLFQEVLEEIEMLKTTNTCQSGR